MIIRFVENPSEYAIKYNKSIQYSRVNNKIIANSSEMLLRGWNNYRNSKYKISDEIVEAYQYLHKRCVEDKPRLSENKGS